MVSPKILSPSLQIILIFLILIQTSNPPTSSTSATSPEMVVGVESSLSADELLLKPMYEVTKVLNATPNQRKFKQDLTYRNSRLVLRTGDIPTDKVKILQNQYGKYVSLPLDPWIRQQLNILEEFLITNLSIPSVLCEGWKAREDTDTPYKCIWDGEQIFIGLSKWCSYFRQDPEYLSETSFSEMGDGTLSIAISLLGVYYGPHKDNKLASLSMFVQSILYKPKAASFDAILEEAVKESAPTSKAVKHAKRRRKKENQ